MRIIDKNTDFYDYLQNVYRDNSMTVDRTDSCLLTKEMLCDDLRFSDSHDSWNYKFVLLQVCNTFWLFLVEITDTNYYDVPTAYNIELLKTWKNYDGKRELMKLYAISFNFDIEMWFRKSNKDNKASMLKRLDTLVQAIDTNNFRIHRNIHQQRIFYGNHKSVVKHIPLLKACGIANCINPLDIYLSFEEYFSLEKSSAERTESVNITDKEKIENHGFDTKKSFREKRK